MPGPAPEREVVEAELARLRGEIEQRPPAYSAVKVGGRRAYAMARAGEAVELAPRTVTIHRLEVVSWDASDPDRPIAVLDVECSAGTYVRALARDLGETVGSAAYLGALVRTASGPFRLDAAVGLDDVRAAAAAGPDALTPLLLPLDAGLDAYPEVVLAAAEVAAIARGQFVRRRAGFAAGAGEGSVVRVRDGDGRLVAMAVVRGDRLAPDKVLVDPSAAGPEAGRLDPDVAAAAEADPPPSVDPDPASPDDA